MGPGTSLFITAGKRKSFKKYGKKGKDMSVSSTPHLMRPTAKHPHQMFKMRSSMGGSSAPRLPSVKSPRSSMFKKMIGGGLKTPRASMMEYSAVRG